MDTNPTTPETASKKVKKPSLHAQAQALLSERISKFDPLATEQDCIDDLRELQQEHPDSFISRNFYRVHGKYSDATWNSKFGTFHEFRRQAGLELSRAQHQLEKHVAKHKSHDVYRDILNTELLPYVGKFQKPEDTKRFKTVMVCSDLHDRHLDPFTWRVFLDTAARVQPDVVCLAGDVFDSTEFGKYEFDPRQVNVKEAFRFVKEEVFAKLRKVCPDSEISWVIGNHDWRIVKHIADKSPYFRVLLSDVVGLTLADIFGLEQYKINLHCRTDLNEFTPAGTRDKIKQNFAVFYETLVVDHHDNQGFGMSGCSGHVHRTGMNSSVNLVRGPIHWVTMGCMAKVDFDYAERLNKSHQSFVVWYVDTAKKQASPEHVIFSDYHAVAVGKYYTRNAQEQ